MSPKGIVSTVSKSDNLLSYTSRNEINVDTILLESNSFSLFSASDMSEIAVEDLPIDDLVELFKKQVNLYGVGKCAQFLRFDGTDNHYSDADDNDIRGDQPDSSDDSSVDVFSEDSSCDKGDGSDSNSDTDSLNGDDHSDNGSVDGVFQDNGVIHLHDPVDHDAVSLHCPPFASIETTMYGVCDCNDYGMDVCGCTDEFYFFSALNLVGEYEEALLTIDSADRIPANKLRKRLYIKLFHATDFGILEKKERRKLPNCAVARVRQIYPSKTGDYMGFREN